MACRLEKRWTEEEIKILKKFYLNRCVKKEEILLQLNNRTWGAVKSKASELKINRKGEPKRQKNLSLLTGRNENFCWVLHQFVDECGIVHGTGNFGLVSFDLRKELNRNWNRIRVLGTSKDGKFIRYSGLNKRKYPENKKCELCNEKINGLVYHHWDDENPNKGMWICNKCHWVITYLEMTSMNFIKNVLEKYMNMKKKINLEFD